MTSYLRVYDVIIAYHPANIEATLSTNDTGGGGTFPQPGADLC